MASSFFRAGPSTNVPRGAGVGNIGAQVAVKGTEGFFEGGRWGHTGICLGHQSWSIPKREHGKISWALEVYRVI